MKPIGACSHRARSLTVTQKSEMSHAVNGTSEADERKTTRRKIRKQRFHSSGWMQPFHLDFVSVFLVLFGSMSFGEDAREQIWFLFGTFSDIS